MKASKLKYDDIEFINRCCDNDMYECSTCKFKFSKEYHTNTYKNIHCVCDMRHLDITDFTDIEECVEILSEIAEEEIGDVK